MSPEEIAQSEKGSDFGNVIRRLRGRHGFEFVRPWFDSVHGEFESEVTDLCCAEKRLGQVDLQSVFPQSGKELFQNFQVLAMIFSVN